MHAARTAARGESWDKTVYSYLSAAKSESELGERLAEVKQAAERAARSVRNYRKWA